MVLMSSVDPHDGLKEITNKYSIYIYIQYVHIYNLFQHFHFRYEEKYAPGMMQEYKEITAWIESCNIPIQLVHWDCDPKNLLYNEDSGVLTVIDYECANTEPYTHDIGRYFLGYLGIPFNFRYVNSPLTP